MLIAGLLPYWDQFGQSENVFGDFAFPLATFVWLFGVLAGLHIALTKFANVNLPERVLDFTWSQIHLVLGVFCVLVQVFWLISSDWPDKGIGFWLLTLGAIALVVGAVMRLQESPSPAGGSAPPTAF